MADSPNLDLSRITSKCPKFVRNIHTVLFLDSSETLVTNRVEQGQVLFFSKNRVELAQLDVFPEKSGLSWLKLDLWDASEPTVLFFAETPSKHPKNSMLGWQSSLTLPDSGLTTLNSEKWGGKGEIRGESIWIAADGGWRAAAPGLKTLRLPCAQTWILVCKRVLFWRAFFADET